MRKGWTSRPGWLRSDSASLCDGRSSLQSKKREAWLSNPSSNAQEGRRNGSSALVEAFVLAVEQNLQLLLKIGGPTIFFCSFKCIHGRSIICSEQTQEL